MMTSFPVFPLAKLSKSIDYGLTASASWEDVGPKFLRITDIQEGLVDWNKVPYCDSPNSNHERYTLRAGDVVFARTGATTGKSFLIGKCPDDSVFASYLIRVRPSTNRVEPTYLSNFFQSQMYWAQISSNVNGSAQPGVNASKLKRLKIPLPPLAEQRRIADILDRADALRRKQREAIQLTEELLRSTFLEMFGDPVTNPKGWDVVPLSKVLSRIDAGWSAKGESRPKIGEEFGVLKISAVTSGWFKPEENKAIQAHEIERDIIVPKRGDLLFSRANTSELVGAACIVESDESHTFLPDKLWRLRTVSSVASPEYILHLLKHRRVQARIARLATGSSGSMQNISQSKLRQLRLPMPDIHIQKKFSSFFWSTLDVLKALRATSNETDTLFHALSQRAFKGDL